MFRSIAPAILWITFANGTALGTTPDHEVWTNEDGWTTAKRVEVGDSFAARMMFDWLVTCQVVATNPASAVRGPTHVTKRGKTKNTNARYSAVYTQSAG